MRSGSAAHGADLVWALVFVSVCTATSSAPLLRSERLIGWKGETHSVQASVTGPLPSDRRQGCTSVNAATDAAYAVQTPGSQWLYTYPKGNTGPRYTHMAMITQLPNGTLLAAWQAADS
mmetsp:Transcript_13075/g.23292  ORF Transcript_13075/g.23292 Transcript_13075/m.23292 type:complete len:119 (+) Transcript_13075:173-529(+)